jgi:nucleotide-binding universal stress UspA family protein
MSHFSRLTAGTFVIAMLFGAVAPVVHAQPAAPAAEDAEAKYTADITTRAAKIVDGLSLTDAAVADRAKATLVKFYRTLRDWHDAHGADRKSLAKESTDDAKAKLQSLNDDLANVRADFAAQLASDGLTEEQIVKVKDGLTYNVRNVTYDAYCDQVLKLTDEEKAQIMTWLTEARDLAISEGSSNDKHAVFGKYKGRINNYLSKRGYDMKAEENAWRERLKQRRAAASQPATKPSN